MKLLKTLGTLIIIGLIASAFIGTVQGLGINFFLEASLITSTLVISVLYLLAFIAYKGIQVIWRS